MEESELVSSLIPAVEEQLNSRDTTYVRKTYQRLLKTEDEGEVIDEALAKKMIALCLADESNRMFIDKRSFDELRYQELLNALPELPE
ncbi:hypothetical protein [Rubritalea marina]|uniref:hypothetical protein n=1 Tax=Rubritalea marina TaxID=361055 RepID=UPI000364FA78|nr:hypothetical protein [Rubritalea marina]